MTKIWDDGGFVDCSDFLKSIDYYKFEDLEAKPNNDVENLHGALFAIYKQVQEYDIVSLAMNTDYLIEMGFDSPNISIFLKKPIHQPIFIFDMKVQDGVFFLGVYYSTGNQFGEVCLDHGFSYSSQRKIWFYREKLGDESVNAFLKQNLTDFFLNIKTVSRIFFYKSTQQKFFRVK